MKFSEMPYARPDLDAVKQQFADLLARFKALCRIRDMPHQVIAFIKGVRSFTAEIRLTARDSPPG